MNDRVDDNVKNRVRFLVLFGLASFAIVLAVTLVPVGTAPVDYNLECLPCGERGVADFIANLLLFVPLGVVVGVARGVLAAVIVGAAMSFGVEAIQWLAAIPGRHVTLADVLANTLGAFAGGCIGRYAQGLLFPTRRQAAALFVLHTTFAAILLAFGNYLLGRPESPEQYMPEVSSLPYTTGYGWFERDVVSGAVDGVQFDHLKGGALRVAALQRDTQLMAVEVRGRDRREGFVPVLFMHDRMDSVAHVIIGQRGDRYALRVGVRANRWGLHLPDLVVLDPVGVWDTVGTPGIHRRIGASVWDGTWRVVVNSDSGRSSATHRLHALQAWLLVVPFDRVNSGVATAGTVAYALVLFVPMVFFGWRCVRR